MGHKVCSVREVLMQGHISTAKLEGPPVANPTVEVVVHGYSGTTKQHLELLQGDKQTFDLESFHLCIILSGTNDVGHG